MFLLLLSITLETSALFLCRNLLTLRLLDSQRRMSRIEVNLRLFEAFHNYPTPFYAPRNGPRAADISSIATPNSSKAILGTLQRSDVHVTAVQRQKT
jgi:hypothetical protein